MNEPLNQFADRLIRNGELREFLKALVSEKEVSPSELINAAEEGRKERDRLTSRRVGFLSLSSRG